jgi:NTE family protein
MGRRTTGALTLGSGGARGYAHIGAIQVLQERHIDIVAVAGASMGAVVGGVYAAGHLDRYTKWVLGLTPHKVRQLLDWSFRQPGIIRAERVLNELDTMLDGARIEQLSVSFTAVATDLYARKEVWLQEGPLNKAIRASFAMPGLFTPVMVNSRLLVDGGLVAPLPVAATASVAADVTIAIDLGGERKGPPNGNATQERRSDDWIDTFRRGPAQIMEAQVFHVLWSRFPGAGKDEPTAAASDPSEPFPPGLSKLDVMNYSLDAMQAVVTRYCLAANPPDILITVPRDACHTFDYHRAAELIALGRTLTAEALDHAARAGLSL